MINRNNDLVYGDEDLEFLYKYNKFPAFMGCVDAPIENDMLFDMSWHISKNSGMIQLNPLLPLEIVYKESHFSGTVGKIWDNHHENFSIFISKYKPKNVLEIGGFHAILANKCFKYIECNWTIIDPNPEINKDSKIKTIKGFFDETFDCRDDYDAVIHSHLMEHIYDINKFLDTLSNILKEKSKVIFSVPDLKVMLEKKSTNALNFEHTYYISEDYIDFFLSKYKFKIIEKVKYLENNSIFYCVEKNNNEKQIKLKNNFYKTNKKLFLNCVNQNAKEIKKINKLISKFDSNIYLFGAHIFSQMLISNGLQIEKIKNILDNDVRKQEKRLYGTNLFVKSPSILKNEEQPIVILKAGIYNSEIKKEILENINRKTIFIE
jgi:SAM-dependent methyltransferase